VSTIGRNVTGAQGDVRQLEDLDQLYARIASDGRKLDVVVANVGAVNSVKLADVSLESFNHNFDTNARGVLFTVQKALPLLNNGASIILTSTIASHAWRVRRPPAPANWPRRQSAACRKDRA
jgi:NAD(P)-dependent dehydrogenase (short-subunit alcohol dehydrogenase family)